MKRFLIGALCAIAVGSAQASYLWFAVQQSEIPTIAAWAASRDLSAYDLYARVVAVDNNGVKTRFDGDDDVAGFVNKWNTSDKNVANIGDLKGDGYSYYIEVVNYANNVAEVIGYSATQTYATMSSSFTDGMSEVPGMTVWHGGGYSAVPEPTSAVLMLLGVAGLALRRKQRNAA